VLRWVIAVAAALVLVAAVFRSLDHASWIYYYRVVDEHSVVVGTVTGSGAWTRVTSVNEAPSTVTITVSSFLIEIGAQAAVGIPVESTATLRDPLAGRAIIDGSSGLVVRQTHCLPPAYFAAGCTP